MLEIGQNKLTNYLDEKKARGSGQLASRRELDNKSFYDKMYDKFKLDNNLYLDDNMWTNAAIKGELDQLIYGLNNSSKGNNYLDSLEEFKDRVDYDTYMLALTMPNLDNEIAKDRISADGTYNFGKMTDLQWAEKILQSTKDRYTAEVIEESKENQTFWQRAAANIVSGVGHVAKGVVSAVSNAYNLVEGLIFAVHPDKYFLEAFDNDDYLSNVKEQLDYALYQFDMLTMLKVDAVDAYEQGFDFHAVDNVDISLGDKAFAQAVKNSGYGAGYTTWGRWWSSGLDSIGEMLPFMAIPNVGKVATKILKTGGFYTTNVFSSSMSDTVRNAKLNGISYADMNVGEVLSNASKKAIGQYLVEFLLGKVLGFTGLDRALGVGEDISTGAAAMFAKAASTTGAKAAGVAIGRGVLSMIKEGLEELFQDLSDGLIDTVFNKTVNSEMYNFDFSWQNLGDAFVVGALTSGVIGSLSSASVILNRKNRTVAINEDGKAYRMGIFQQLNYNQAMQAMASWQEILQDSKASTQEKADAAFKMNGVLSTVGNVLKTFGTERTKKAMELLTQYQNKLSTEEQKREAKLKLSDVEYAKALMDDFLKGSVQANLRYLTQAQEEKARKAAEKEAKLLKKNGVTKVENIVTEKTVTTTDNKQSVDAVKNLLKQTGSDILISTDGTVVIKSDDVIFAPDSLVKAGKVSEILEGIAYDKAIKAIAPELNKKQNDLILEEYQKLTDRKDATIDDALIALLFDKSFYTYILFRVSESEKIDNKSEALKLLTIIDNIVKNKVSGDVDKNSLTQAAYQKLIQKIQESMQAGIAIFAMNYVNLDLDAISAEILPASYKNVIRNNKNVIISEVASSDNDNKQKEALTDESIAEFDRHINKFIGKLEPEFDEMIAEAKQKIRSTDFNDRFDARGLLRYLMTIDEDTQYIFLKPDDPNKTIDDSNKTILLVTEFFDTDWDNLVKGNFKLEDLPDQAQKYILTAGFDITNRSNRIAMLRERLYYYSNNTLTISNNGEVLEVLDKNKLVKKEYLGKNGERKLIADIKANKVKQIKDVCKITINKTIGNLKIKLSSTLDVNGYFDEFSPNKIVVGKLDIVNNIMHEATHATQYFTRSQQSETYVAGANKTLLDKIPGSTLDNIDEYIAENFPLTYRAMLFHRTNDVPDIIYFNVEGEMEATCKLTSTLFENGFTWSNNRTILHSPDSKESWDLTVDTDKTSKTKSIKKEVKENEQQSGSISNVSNGPNGKNTVESIEQVDKATAEPNSIGKRAKEIRSRFEKIDGYKVTKAGDVYANVKTDIDQNNEIVKLGKNKYGVEVRTFTGVVYNTKGETIVARGFTDGKSIYLQEGLDNKTAKKVLKHEYFHIKALQNKLLYEQVRDTFIKNTDKNQRLAVIAQYSSAYAGLSTEQVLEEIMADVFAGFITIENKDIQSFNKNVKAMMNNKGFDAVKSKKTEPKTSFSLFNLREDKMMALTNMNIFGLTQLLQNEEINTPSIAVNLEHSNKTFGDVTVVWNKNLVDPEFADTNRTFYTDAWTRRLPVRAVPAIDFNKTNKNIVTRYLVNATVDLAISNLLTEDEFKGLTGKSVDEVKEDLSNLLFGDNTKIDSRLYDTKYLTEYLLSMIFEAGNNLAETLDTLRNNTKNGIHDFEASQQLLKEADEYNYDIIRLMMARRFYAPIEVLLNTFNDFNLDGYWDYINAVASAVSMNMSTEEISQILAEQIANSFEGEQFLRFAAVRISSDDNIEDRIRSYVVQNGLYPDANNFIDSFIDEKLAHLSKEEIANTVKRYIKEFLDEYIAKYDIAFRFKHRFKNYAENEKISKEQADEIIKEFMLQSNEPGDEFIALFEDDLPSFVKYMADSDLKHSKKTLANYISLQTIREFETFKEMKIQSANLHFISRGEAEKLDEDYRAHLTKILSAYETLFDFITVEEVFETVRKIGLYKSLDDVIKAVDEEVLPSYDKSSQITWLIEHTPPENVRTALLQALQPLYGQGVISKSYFDILSDNVLNDNFDLLTKNIKSELRKLFIKMHKLNNKRLESTHMFEAKPLRAVSLSDCTGIIVPTIYKKLLETEPLKSKLEKHNIIVRYYKQPNINDVEIILRDEFPDEVNGKITKFSVPVEVKLDKELGETSQSVKIGADIDYDPWGFNEDAKLLENDYIQEKMKKASPALYTKVGQYKLPLIFGRGSNPDRMIENYANTKNIDPNKHVEYSHLRFLSTNPVVYLNYAITEGLEDTVGLYICNATSSEIVVHDAKNSIDGATIFEGKEWLQDKLALHLFEKYPNAKVILLKNQYELAVEQYVEDGKPGHTLIIRDPSVLIPIYGPSSQSILGEITNHLNEYDLSTDDLLDDGALWEQLRDEHYYSSHVSDNSQISESRKVSNKIAAQSNLKYYIRKGRQIQLDEKVQNFVKYTTADFDKLEPVIQKGIKAGELDLQTLEYYMDTANSMNDYTFKMIARYIYENEEAAKLTFADMQKILNNSNKINVLEVFLIDNNKREYSTKKLPFSKMLHAYDEIAKSKPSKWKTYQNQADFIKYTVKGQTVYDEVSEIDPTMLHGSFMRYYDSTIKSVAYLNKLGKLNYVQTAPLSEGTKGSSTTWKWLQKLERKAVIKYTITDKEIAKEMSNLDRVSMENVIIAHIEAEVRDAIIKGELKITSRDEMNFEIDKRIDLLDKLTDEEVHMLYLAALQSKSVDPTKVLEYLFTDDENVLESKLDKRYKRRETNEYKGKYVSRTSAKQSIKGTANRVAQKLSGLKIRYDSLPEDLKPLFDRKADRSYEFNDEYLKMTDAELDALSVKLQAANSMFAERIRLVEEAKKTTEKAIERANRQAEKMAEKMLEQENKKTKKTMREEVDIVHVVELKEEKFNFLSREQAPKIVKTVLGTSWDKTRESTVQKLDNNVEQDIANAELFFESNTEMLNMSLAEAEQAAKWFMDARINNTNSPQEKKKFAAIRLMFLSHILIETKENGQFEKINANVKNKIKDFIRDLATEAGTTLSVWNNVLKRLNPLETMISHSITIGGVELTEVEKEDLYSAVRTGDMETLAKMQTRILERIKKSSTTKKHALRRITTARAMSMLTGPLTWLRNIVSNVALKYLNVASSKIGNAIFTSKTSKSQLKFTANVTQQITDFINENFIQNKLFDNVISNISKYNPSDISRKFKNNDGSIDKNAILYNMVIKSMYGKYYSENMFKSKLMNDMYKGLMKVMSDNNYVREAAIRYFGKIIAENNYDLSKGVTDQIMTDFANAIGIAMSDYMHSDNFFNTLEQIAADHGELTLFAYKNLLPFMATSWNWFKAGIRFSPIGLVNSIIKLTRLENNIRKQQNRWAQGKSQVAPEYTEYLIRRDIGSGIIGTVGFGVGILLSLLGFIDLEDDDYGIPKINFNIGGKNVKIDVSSIFGTSSVLAGAALITDMKNDGISLDTLISGLDKALDVTLEGFFLTELMSLDMYASGGSFATTLDWFESMLLSFIPNGLAWIAGATYTGTVRKSGLFRKAAARVPFLAGFIAKKVDPYTGDTGSGWDAFNRIFPYFDINMRSRIKETAKSLGLSKSELRGNYTINDEPFELSNKEITEINKQYGEWNAKDLMAFMTDEVAYKVKDDLNNKYSTLTYSEMTDKQRKNTINTIMSNNAENAKILAWLNAGYAYYASASKYAELKQLGVKGKLYKGSKGFVKA